MIKQAFSILGLSLLISAGIASADPVAPHGPNPSSTAAKVTFRDDFNESLQKALIGYQKSWIADHTPANAKTLAKQVDILYAQFFKKLSSSQIVSDDSILTMKEICEFTDNDLNHAENYALTSKFIDEVLPLIPENKSVTAWLLTVRTNIICNDVKADKAVAIKGYETALAATEKIYFESQRNRLQTKYNLANLYFDNGEKQKAIEQLSAINSNDWFTVRDDEYSQIFGDLYKNALLLRIRINAGDLAALNDIYYYPAVEEEVGPAKREAIAAAEEQMANTKKTVKP